MKIAAKIVREQSGAYRASCPALPGCTVRAASYEEARAKLDEAVRGYLCSLDVALPKESGREMLIA